MAIFLLRGGSDRGEELIDGVQIAVVQAADEAGARTAAKALDTRIRAAYWDQATVIDIETPGNFTGSLFTNEPVAGSVS